MATREEKKAEAKLKALLKEAANKRCINCDALGPQYVVSNFNVFVCTVCSGVHRQFGHRVKGVSMSTFKADEVAALEEAGNARFAAFFLHKWQSAALPKPVDRDVHRIHAWIQAVYQDRRFHGEPPGGYALGAAAAAGGGGSTASEGEEVVVRPLSEVLGSDTPKLKVQGSGNLERSVSAVSSSAGAGTTPTKAANDRSGSTAARGLNLMDGSSPKSAKSAPPRAVPAAGAATAAWDPFGDSTPAAAAPEASSSPGAAAAAAAAAGQGGSLRPAASPAGEAAWAVFGDAPAPAAQEQQQPAAPAAAPAASASPAAASDWEAFGDGSSEPAAPPAAAPAAAAASPASSSSPGKPVARQPVHSSSRPEVSMDIFYPEFEQIRATGILPTGQPVPLHAFPASYGGARPATAGNNPYATYGVSAAAAHQQQQQQHPQQQAYGGYGAAAGGRPTIAIPPAPLQPGGYGGGGGGYGGMSPSPAQGRPGMPSPGYSASSGLSPAGSAISPAGSGFSSALSQPAANGGGSYSYPGPAGSSSYASLDSAGGLRSSAGSLSELMMPPGSAVPTPVGGAGPAHRLGDPSPNDPFAGLAPGLRGALPSLPESSRYGGAPGAPPPTPAGLPPFGVVNGGGYAAQASAPFAAAPMPAASAGLAPATAAASATLFGGTPSLTGYDLSAPSAPKPQSSGNPFA